MKKKKKPLSGQGDFHVRADLSHLPGSAFFPPFFFSPLLQPKGSGTTGCYQTRSEEEEGKDGGNEDGGERERGTDRIESPRSHAGNINPLERKGRRGLTFHRGFRVL